MTGKNKLNKKLTERGILIEYSIKIETKVIREINLLFVTIKINSKAWF